MLTSGIVLPAFISIVSNELAPEGSVTFKVTFYTPLFLKVYVGLASVEPTLSPSNFHSYFN